MVCIMRSKVWRIRIILFQFNRYIPWLEFDKYIFELNMEFPEYVSKIKFNGNQNGWTNVCLHLSSMWITYPHLRLFRIFIGKWTCLSHFKMFYHIQWTTCTSNEFDKCFNNNKSLQRDKMNPLSRLNLFWWFEKFVHQNRQVQDGEEMSIKIPLKILFTSVDFHLSYQCIKLKWKLKKKPLTLLRYENILIPTFVGEITACGI